MDGGQAGGDQVARSRMSRVGHPQSAATRAKIRTALAGRVNGPMSHKTRRRISEAKRGVPNLKLRGLKRSKEDVEKMRQRLRGRRLSEAHRRHIAEAQRGHPNNWLGRHHTEEAKARIGRGVRAAFQRRQLEKSKSQRVTSIRARRKEKSK